MIFLYEKHIKLWSNRQESSKIEGRGCQELMSVSSKTKKRNHQGNKPKTKIPANIIKDDDTKKELEEMKKWADSEKEKTKDEAKEKKAEVKSEGKKDKTIDSSQMKPKAEKKETKKEPEKPKPKAEPVKVKEVKKPVSTKPSEKAKPKVSAKGPKPKKKHNYLLWATIVVIAIPCLILLYIIIGSRENSNEPVEGSRFDASLDPAITEEDLTALKGLLVFDNVEHVEINLKSATLRVTLNTNDDLSQEAIQELMGSAYDKIVEKLPVDTYFTNKTKDDKTVKMYDLEVSAYNYIPEKDEDKAGQIHLSRTKNSAAEKVVDDVLSSPKDEETADPILNPDTSNPPTSEETNEGE